MNRHRLQGLIAGLLVSGAAWLGAQPNPQSVVAISGGDIDAVLMYSGSEGAGTDRQIRVVDLGAYRLGVGVLHRGPTRAGSPVGAISRCGRAGFTLVLRFTHRPPLDGYS